MSSVPSPSLIPAEPQSLDLTKPEPTETARIVVQDPPEPEPKPESQEPPEPKSEPWPGPVTAATRKANPSKHYCSEDAGCVRNPPYGGPRWAHHYLFHWECAITGESVAASEEIPHGEYGHDPDCRRCR